MSRLLRQRGLLRLEPPDAHQIDVRLLTLAGLFAISIPIAFVTPLAFAIWIAGPVLGRVWRLTQSRGGAAASPRCFVSIWVVNTCHDRISCP